MADLKGAIATAMAAADVKGNGERKAEKRELIPFVCLGFKLPNGKVNPFKNEDGSITKRLAYALMQIKGSEIHFNASIYETEGGQNPGIYCAMPSSGKGFPRPVFVTDHPATQNAYETWRDSIVDSYFAWEAKLSDGDRPVSSNRRQRPAAQAQVSA